MKETPTESELYVLAGGGRVRGSRCSRAICLMRYKGSMVVAERLDRSDRLRRIHLERLEESEGTLV